MGSRTERDEFTMRLLEQVDTIRRIGWKRLRDVDALDDFTQETLARAFTNRSALRDEVLLPNWVARIALNLARRWSRSTPISVVERIPEISAPAPSPLERMEDRERRQALLNALDSLNPSERLLILSHYLDGESCAVLAKRHRLSHSTVKVRLHRARQKLRRRLAAWAACVVAIGNVRGAAGSILIMKTGTKVGIVAAAIFGIALTVMVSIRRGGFETRPDRDETKTVEETSLAGNPHIQRDAASANPMETSSRSSEKAISPTSTEEPMEGTKPSLATKEETGKLPSIPSRSSETNESATQQTADSAPQTLTPQQQELYNIYQDQLFLQRAYIMTMQELNRSGPKIPPKPGPAATPEEIRAWETEARQKQREIMTLLEPIQRALSAKADETVASIRALVPGGIALQTKDNLLIDRDRVRQFIGGRFPSETLRLPPISVSITIDGPDGTFVIEATDGPEGGPNRHYQNVGGKVEDRVGG